MLDFTRKARYGFDDLVKLVALLRAPGGCPWDGAQTHLSIRRNFLEEAYEACEGFDRDDAAIMREELGDVLLQVVFHADIEREAGRFTMDDVCDGICKKLIYRHPALFSDETPPPDWDTIKRREKGQKTLAEELDGVARSLPALVRAEKICRKLAKVFPAGWEDTNLDTMEKKDVQPVSENSVKLVTDMLVQAVRAGIGAGVSSEEALHEGCELLVRHTARVTDILAARGQKMEDISPEELQALWKQTETEADKIEE